MYLTKLQESLLVLTGIEHQIESALQTLVPKEHIEDDNLKFTVCNHLHIIICSFLDEWKILESLGEDSEIQKTLLIASPAINCIRSWKGLEKIRSQLLAHGHRDKNGHVAWAWDVFARYNAPTAYGEMIVLGNCAVKAIKIAFLRHQKEHEEASMEIKKLNRDIEEKGARTVGDIKLELEKTDNKIKEIAQSIT